MNNLDFYRCSNCGEVITVLTNGGGNHICCGSQMTKLIANTSDVGTEKHMPVITRENGKIIAKCGEVPHPMLENHYIQWMALVSKNHVEMVFLHPGDEPVAVFNEVEHGAVYAYCNLHSLWLKGF